MSEPLDVTLCVDAIEPHLSGIGRYTWELSQRLPRDPDIKSVRYFARRRLIDDPDRLLRGETIYPGQIIRRTARGWLTRRALQSTIVHAPNYFLPPSAPGGVVTVHDLSVFRYPETHPAARLREFERLFASSLSRASQIITDSETVRRELIESHSIAPERVTSVPLGVGSHFRPIDDREIAPVIAKWGLQPGRYGLSVAAFEPRKKIGELIAAWRRLPPTVRERYPLALAGPSGWRNDELHDAIRRAEGEGWLKHLGFVGESELPCLYAGARLFAYPSVYEGFGLPPLEAMASGLPVIVANRSCLPEVCGDAARYVDPDDDNDLLTAIEEALVNSDWRKNAIQLGLDRAAQFTWDRCIQATVTVYQLAKYGLIDDRPRRFGEKPT